MKFDELRARAMGLAASSEATEMPALLRCDGDYRLPSGTAAADDDMELRTWCGWLRFEGNGGCVMKRTVEHVDQVRGEWHVVSADAVRIMLPSNTATAQLRDINNQLVANPILLQSATFTTIADDQVDAGNGVISVSFQGLSPDTQYTFTVAKTSITDLAG